MDADPFMADRSSDRGPRLHSYVGKFAQAVSVKADASGLERAEAAPLQTKIESLFAPRQKSCSAAS